MVLNKIQNRKKYVKSKEIIEKKFIILDYNYKENEKYGEFIEFKIKIGNNEFIWNSYSNIIMRQLDGVRKSDIINKEYVLKYEFGYYLMEVN